LATKYIEKIEKVENGYILSLPNPAKQMRRIYPVPLCPTRIVCKSKTALHREIDRYFAEESAAEVPKA
jgi:hypothetical protein